MGDSDEEEMAAMRAAKGYGGGRKPAATATPATSSSAADSAQPRPSAADSDDEDTLASQRRQQQRGPQRPDATKASRGLGPQRPGAKPIAGDDSDEAMSAEEEPDDAETKAMKGFLPVTFGRFTGGQKLSGGANEKTLEAAKRSDHKIASQKKGGVSFGPRSMDLAADVGKSSRMAAASARAAKEAEAKIRAEAIEDEEREKAASGAAAEEESLYGFAEAPPPPGMEDQVIPCTHEAVISAHSRPINAIALDPKGSRMICGSLDGQLKFYDFNGMSEAHECFRELEPIEAHMCQAISFSTTGNCFVCVSSDAHARVFDRDGGSKPIQSTVKGDMYVRDMSHTNGHTQMLTDGMWHPFHPNNWCTSSIDGTIRIWDLTSKPVGMDQVLASMHVLKCLDKRGVCVGGTCGRAGGLYPSCVAYAPTASMIVGGCTDGSIQFFYEKARYQKPDKILRLGHNKPVTALNFLGDGVGGNKLVTRSLDNSMKLWDCRMLSDAKGPVHAWEDLPAFHEKQGLCSSPDGKYIVTGTSLDKANKEHRSLRIYDAEDGSLVKSLDFGQRNVVSCTWQKNINQLLIGTSTGEVVMLYSPYSSKKGALHFVGRHRRARAAHEIEEKGVGLIFPMVEGKDIQKFYQTARGSLDSIRRAEARANQKTITPILPPELDAGQGRTATTSGTKLVSHVILNLEGKNPVAGQDSQKELLKYSATGDKFDKTHAGGDHTVYMGGYAKTQPVNILDYSVEESVGDQMMSKAAGGDFCRKCGVKICRCVDYTMFGDAKKRQEDNKRLRTTYSRSGDATAK